MRVLFVLSSVEWTGVQILISILKRAGHCVDLAAVGGFSSSGYFPPAKRPRFARQLRQVERFRPDVVMCSSTTYGWNLLRALLRQIREHFPRLPMVVGGIHPTVAPDRVLGEPFVDAICVGEGEEAILELLDVLTPGQSPPFSRLDIRNIWFKQNGQVIRNALRPLVSDLDALPFPDKALFRRHGLSTAGPMS